MSEYRSGNLRLTVGWRGRETYWRLVDPGDGYDLEWVRLGDYREAEDAIELHEIDALHELYDRHRDALRAGDGYAEAREMAHNARFRR